MPVLVRNFTVQTLQDAHLTDIGAQLKQSTPTGAADAVTLGYAARLKAMIGRCFRPQ